MEPYEPHLAIATALAVGLLVGLEREQAHPETDISAFAGVRTYPIIALCGAVSGLLANAMFWLPLIALLGLVVLLAISYSDDVKKGRDHSVTTEASVIAVFLLGTLAATHRVLEPMTTRFLLVAILGVILTFLLSSKAWLHAFAARVSRDDFYATVKFLIVAVVVLPLLPREDLGPLDAINPFNLGLMVVTIAGLSFIGYVAVRLLGPSRGLLVGAAAGGLVSSTAVTIAFAHRAKDAPALAPAAAGAIAIAWAIMLARVVVLVGVVSAGLLSSLWMPLAGAAIGVAAGGLLTYHRADHTAGGEITLKNPFELGSAIRFGLVFGVILLATKAANTYFGSSGLYVAAGVGGTTDVDAVTLSTARLAGGGTSAHAATIAIMVAIAANTLVKTSLALGIGGVRLGKRVAVVGGLLIAGGAAGLVAAALVSP